MLKHKSSAIHISTLSNTPSTSARSQMVKPSLIQISSALLGENIPPATAYESALFTPPPTRKRTVSTSSTRTIKSYGDLTKEKKRQRESLDGGRRTRQRTSSTAVSKDGVPCGDKSNTSRPSTDSTVGVPFLTEAPEPSKKSSKTLKAQGKRQISSPMALLIPSRSAPSAPAVTPENVRKGPPVHNPKPKSVAPPRDHPLKDSIPTRFDPYPDAYADIGSWLDEDLTGSPTALSYLDEHVSISFSKRQPHFDVWDLDDDVTIGIPARIHIAPPEPGEAEVQFLSIICQTYEHPFPYPYYLQAEPEYIVSFEGYHRTWTNSAETELDMSRGIIVCPRLFNVTSKMTNIHDPNDRIVTSHRGVLPPDSSTPEDEAELGRGRYIKVLIPVPMWLIRAGNARVFSVQVRAGRVCSDGYGFEEIGKVETEIVVSHLQSENEMGMPTK